MSNKPNPRRDDKGVPWCGGIKESCWRGCQWVNFKICLPQVQLDEAELARLQGIVEKLSKTVDGVPVTQYTTLYYPTGEEIWVCATPPSKQPSQPNRQRQPKEPQDDD